MIMGNKIKVGKERVKKILKCLAGVLARWSRAGRVAGLNPSRSSHEEAESES